MYCMCTISRVYFEYIYVVGTWREGQTELFRSLKNVETFHLYYVFYIEPGVKKDIFVIIRSHILNAP